MLFDWSHLDGRLQAKKEKEKKREETFLLPVLSTGSGGELYRWWYVIVGVALSTGSGSNDDCSEGV